MITGCVILFILFLIVIKPTFLPFLIIIVVLPEYFFTMWYLGRIYAYKRRVGYYCVRVGLVDVSELRWGRLFIEMSRNRAFRRVYVVCLRRSVTPYNILLAFIIFFLGIPMRLVFLLRDLYRGWSDTLEGTVINLYMTNYYSVKELKIEILDGKIYLNCKNLRDLVSLMMRARPHLSKNECGRAIDELKNHTTHFLKYEQTNTERVKFALSQLITPEGFKVPRSHYSYKTELKHVRDGAVIFHATSNTNTQLTLSQTSTIPIPSLAKVGSARPGTVITEVGAELSLIPNAAPKYASKWEVEYIKYSVKWKFNFEIDEMEYFTNKERILSSILYGESAHKSTDIEELAIGHYNVVISSSDSFEIESAIEDYFKNKNNVV